MVFMPGGLFSRGEGTRLENGGTDLRPHDERRADIIRWWAYYHGRDRASGLSQWDFLRRRFETMGRREVEDIENHVQICVNRLRRLLVNSWRGFEFDDDRKAGLVRAIFRRNDWPRLMNLAVLTAHVTGDAFLRVLPGRDPVEGFTARLALLDTESVELAVDPHDRDRVLAITISYDFFEDDDTGRPVRRSYREELRPHRWDVFIDGEFRPEFSGGMNRVAMPVIHIRHQDTGGSIYGESVVARLTDAQDTINLLACDLLDIVRYDGHKTTIFQNVNIDRGASRDGATAGEIDLSIGKGLAVRGDGKVYKLEQQHDLGAALQEYERKLDAFYGLAGVPRLSRDMVSRLGNLSGRAIERLHQDAIDATREAQAVYGAAFEELAETVALAAGIGPVGARALWNTDVISPDIEALGRELELGVRSRRSVMRKLGIGDAEAMLEEIAGEG